MRLSCNTILMEFIYFTILNELAKLILCSRDTVLHPEAVDGIHWSEGSHIDAIVILYTCSGYNSSIARSLSFHS